MSCYVMYSADRTPAGFICGKLGPHCADCGDCGVNLCDFPVGRRGKTCNRAICEYHSHEVAPNMHYCDAHYAEWQAFRDSGGVTKELENVAPFVGA